MNLFVFDIRFSTVTAWNTVEFALVGFNRFLGHVHIRGIVSRLFSLIWLLC